MRTTRTHRVTGRRRLSRAMARLGEPASCAVARSRPSWIRRLLAIVARFLS